MHHISKKQRDAVIVSLLSAVVGTLAYSLFVLHNEAPQVGHGLDISAPLLLERILAFLRGAAE
jgi:hypothetical protein